MKFGFEITKVDFNCECTKSLNNVQSIHSESPSVHKTLMLHPWNQYKASSEALYWLL